MNDLKTCVLVAACLIGITLDRVSLASDIHSDPHWTYEDQGRWNTLLDRTYSPPYPYAECGIGQKQSPINIDPKDVEFTGDQDELNIQYTPIPLSITNNGHTLRLNTSQGYLFIGKSKYELAQLHFHAPSEHALDGKLYPIEAHFVNGTSDGRLAVLSVYFDVGKPNHAFQLLLKNSPALSGTTVNKDQQIDLNELLPGDKQSFYTYSGSLTTPPCSEGVQWFLIREPVLVGADQIKKFQKFYSDNARRPQKMNGRKVHVYVR